MKLPWSKFETLGERQYGKAPGLLAQKNGPNSWKISTTTIGAQKMDLFTCLSNNFSSTLEK